MTLVDWRSRAIAIVVLVQLAVPLVTLVANEPPSRFGFQMYSGLGASTVEVRDSEGELIDDNWRDLIAGQLRADLDWPNSKLPERICQAAPEAATVTIRRGDDERTVTCG